MNYGHITPGLLRQLTGIRSEVHEVRKQWLGTLTDGQLADLIGPGFETFFETLPIEVQWRMSWDKTTAAEVVEAYREWAEEREV